MDDGYLKKKHTTGGVSRAGSHVMNIGVMISSPQDFSTTEGEIDEKKLVLV